MKERVTVCLGSWQRLVATVLLVYKWGAKRLAMRENIFLKRGRMYPFGSLQE